MPGRDYDEKSLESILDTFDGLVYTYDHARDYTDWPDIENTIRYMASMGVKFFFLDPLSALVAHLSASDANTFLGRALLSMSKITQTMPVTIFHVNHLNNPTQGKDHGAGGHVYGGQFAGSRAMWKYSTDLWGLERNQLADDPTERNRSKLVTIKYRKPSMPGSFELDYDIATGTLQEVKKVIL